LRVLQERQVRPLGGRGTVPVNVRVLAAYNVRLVDEILAGRFRQDLYYRLNEFVVIVPPLRARPHDIPYLAKRFLTEASMELRRPDRSGRSRRRRSPRRRARPFGRPFTSPAAREARPRASFASTPRRSTSR